MAASLEEGISLVSDGGTSTQLSKNSVLIADDDAGLRETMKYWLSDRWTVLEAGDGQEVLETLDDTVDVLVLDRDMPKVSGPEVVDQIDQTSFEGTVIVVSAYEPDTHLDETDVDGYITKPVERDQFVTQLQQSVQ